MLFTLVFASIFVAGWSACGPVAWLVASVVSRGKAGLVFLPLAIFTANVAALTVPLVGFDGKGGLMASFGAALAAPAVLLAIRRFSFGPVPREAPPLESAQAEGEISPG